MLYCSASVLNPLRKYCCQNVVDDVRSLSNDYIVPLDFIVITYEEERVSNCSV
jgi:hypothetical protein